MYTLLDKLFPVRKGITLKKERNIGKNICNKSIIILFGSDVSAGEIKIAKMEKVKFSVNSIDHNLGWDPNYHIFDYHFTRHSITFIFFVILCFILIAKD